MQPQRKFFYLGRLISIKNDSRFLSKRILRSLPLVDEYYWLTKKPVPPWVLFVSSKQKASPGKNMLLIGVLSPLVLI